MYFMFSGEGATDLAETRPGPVIAEGQDFLHGPLAVIASQIVEKKRGYSALDTGQCGYVFEDQLAGLTREFKAAKKSMGLPGAKQPKETRYFFNNARLLARIANEMAEELNDLVVAILIRDSDGAASAGRGLWEDKRRSMLHGFDGESFERGVPMIPKPKSEAWLICALKHAPYFDKIQMPSFNAFCSRLEAVIRRKPPLASHD